MQDITVIVGPLASGNAAAVAASQLPNGASALALVGFTADNIALAQTLGAAGPVDLNGASVVDNIANIPGGYSVVITSAGDDRGITFTITGYAYSANGGPASVVETVNGTNTSSVATRGIYYGVTSVVASGATADDITVGTNPKVFTLDKIRRVLWTTTGDETAHTLTINGTDWNGNPVSEILIGVDTGTVETTRDFATITSIYPSAAMTAAITVGTDEVASSRPVYLDKWAFAPVGAQVDVTGTVNYTVQSTFDDPNETGWDATVWVDSSDTNVVSATATKQTFFAYAPRYVRVLLNSGSGTLRMTVWQSGNISGVS